MVFQRKLKLIYPSTHYSNYSAPTFLTLFKKILNPPPFKKEGRDYAFYMRDFKGETIKLLPFYMTDFLFTELYSHNIWRKLKNHMKNTIYLIYSHLIFLTQIYYNMNFITFSSNFITTFHWYFKINLRRLLLEDNFLVHKKCIFRNMPAKLVLRIRNFVKMQENLWKISCSLPNLLKILVFYDFFSKFSDNCILRTSIF